MMIIKIARFLTFKRNYESKRSRRKLLIYNVSEQHKNEILTAIKQGAKTQFYV